MVATEVLIFNDKMWWGGYITNLTMFQEYLSFPNLDFVFWSLTVELAFYLVMGCLVATGLIKQIEFVAALWLMLACLWALFEKHIGMPLPGLAGVNGVEFHVMPDRISKLANQALNTPATFGTVPAPKFRLRPQRGPSSAHPALAPGDATR